MVTLFWRYLTLICEEIFEFLFITVFWGGIVDSVKYSIPSALTSRGVIERARDRACVVDGTF